MSTFVTEFQIHKLKLDGTPRLENERMRFWKLVGTLEEPDFMELARRVGLTVEEFAKEHNVKAVEEKYLPK